MCLNEFLKAERGAVTVDWVVLSGALVGLGIAATGVVTGGVEDLSGEVSTALVDMDVETVVAAVEEAFTNATAGLTQTSVWDDPNATSKEFANVDQLSFSTEVTFSDGDEGIIFETGGSGRGIILYQHEGTLYLQAGSGNGYGETGSRGEASWDVSEGTHTIEGSMNADGGLALYVNGEIVDQSSFEAPSLAGGNAGTVGGGASSVAVNRGGYNRNSEGHPGVSQVAFYEDQTTGDELIPLD